MNAAISKYGWWMEYTSWAILMNSSPTLQNIPVFEAECAVGAIATAKKEKPDIIIMDVRLPDMRGTQAAKILREDKGMIGVPIVFVTASVMAEGLEELQGISNSGFIGKPINTRYLCLRNQSIYQIGF